MASDPRKRRYWWVSQNRTGQQEIAGGYLWSPKKDSSGARNFSYELMKECAPGDIVFSFVNAAISTIGFVKGYCYESDKPDEFHAAGNRDHGRGTRLPCKQNPHRSCVRFGQFGGNKRAADLQSR